MWQGLLALKNDQSAVQMHFVFGNPHVARDSLPCNSDGSTPPLRIAQRMRLEQTQLEGVARKMQVSFFFFSFFKQKKIFKKKEKLKKFLFSRWITSIACYWHCHAVEITWMYCSKVPICKRDSLRTCNKNKPPESST